MKNSKKIRLVLLQLAFISATTFIFSSCENRARTEDSKQVVEDKNDTPNDAKISGMKNEDDANFLADVAEINQEEITLGKLAQSKGSMTDVKELGSMMEKAHTKAMTDLSTLATQKSITLPEVKTDDVNDEYKKMSEKKSGKEFDKAYSDKMVDGHKKAIEKFEKASTDSNDPDIKAMATNMLPELRKHLEMSQMCQKKCESMK